MRKQATRPEVDINGLPNLPFGWAWATVGELTASEPNSITDGPFGSNLKTAHYTASGPRVIRLQNIGDGVFVDALAHISQDHYDSLSKHRVEAGDIVIAALGESLPRACVIPESVGPAIVKADCIRFKPDHRFASKFLSYALNAEATRTRTSAVIHGVGRPRLNLSEVKAIILPIAPPEEQRRIVAAIEQQFTRLDAAVAELEQARVRLKRYRVAVLAAACTGRLVPTEAELARAEGREYESADRLLSRVLVEAGVGARRPVNGRLPVRQDSQLPEGWCSVTLPQLVTEPLANGRSVPDAQNGFPVLRLSALKHGQIDLTQRKVGAWTEDEANQYKVRKGDFLVARGNGSIALVGRGGLVEADPDGIAYPDTLIRVRVNPDVMLPKYLRAVWNSEPVRRQVESTARTTAGIYKINQQDMQRYVLPLPPLAEQHRIVAEVERRLSVITGLEATVAANLKRATRLRQAILQRAFVGQLVPQDPTDEPASQLLDRISLERTAEAGRRDRRSRSGGNTTMTRNQPSTRATHSEGITLPLDEVLASSHEPLTPEELFRRAGYSIETIDQFYDALALAIESGHVKELRPDSIRVSLKASRE